MTITQDDRPASGCCAPSPYSADEFDPERNCMTCGGDGWEDSDSLMEEDPLWWEGVDMIPCRNCGGSGLRKDQTCF